VTKDCSKSYKELTAAGTVQDLHLIPFYRRKDFSAGTSSSAKLVYLLYAGFSFQ
jgi:hypothetical protein